LRLFVDLPASKTDDIIQRMKKDYLPIAVGLWGIAVPLLVSVFIYCKTAPQKIAVALSALVFSLLGLLIYKAK
jgi:hypothetical protein